MSSNDNNQASGSGNGQSPTSRTRQFLGMPPLVWDAASFPAPRVRTWAEAFGIKEAPSPNRRPAQIHRAAAESGEDEGRGNSLPSSLNSELSNPASDSGIEEGPHLPMHSSPIPNRVREWVHPATAFSIRPHASVVVPDTDEEDASSYSELGSSWDDEFDDRESFNRSHVSDSDGWSDAEDIFEFGFFQSQIMEASQVAQQQGPRRVALEPVSSESDNNLYHAPSRPADEIFNFFAIEGRSLPARGQNFPARLRVSFPHPDLALVQAPVDFECPICIDNSTLPSIAIHPCGRHYFHQRCLLGVYHARNFNCPICRQQAPL